MTVGELRKLIENVEEDFVLSVRYSVFLDDEKIDTDIVLKKGYEINFEKKYIQVLGEEE